MRNLGKFALAFSLLSFFACTTDSVTKPKEAEEESTIGWREANFMPDRSTLNTQGGGLQKMVHSGEWVVLEDAWTSPVENHPGYSTWTPRLFISKIGSDVWDTISPPTKNPVLKLYADSIGIYVSVKYSAEFFRYFPEEKRWQRFSLMDSIASGEWWSIYGIGRYQGKLIISLAGYLDSLAEENKEITAFVKWGDENGFEDLDVSPRLHYDVYFDSLTVPFQFHKGVEWNGIFYAATMDGVWYLEGVGQKWKSAPEIPKEFKYQEPYKKSAVTDILVHRNEVVALGDYSSSIYGWDGTSASWRRMNDIELDDEGGGRSNVTLPKAIVSNGEHLFVTGDPSCPRVYMGDYGEPYGNIEQGWRFVRAGWCKKTGCPVGSALTYSIDIVGDTLYAPTWVGLYKFPLADLDSAISGQSDFRRDK